MRSSVLLIGLGVLLALAFKFFGSSRPTPTSFAGFIADPAIAGGRFLVLLGSPFRPYGFGLPSQVMNAVCLAGGLTFVCLLSWACRRGVIGRVLDERSATLLMLLFALGSAGSAAAGRVSLGIGQAASSRYVIVASIAWVLLASLFVRSRELRAEHGDTQTRRSPRWLIAVPVAYLAITTYGVLPTLRGRHDELEQSMEQWTQTSTGLIHGEGMSVEPMFARAIERGDFRLP